MILAPQLGIKPAPPALEGEVLTTGPPGKSLSIVFLSVSLCIVYIVVALGITSHTQFIAIYWPVRLNMDPRDVHVLIPGTYKYVTSRGKRDFADMIELQILGWGDYPGGPNVTTRVFIRRRQESQCERLRYDDGKRSGSEVGPRCKEYGGPLEDGKGQEVGSSGVSRWSTAWSSLAH